MIASWWHLFPKMVMLLPLLIYVLLLSGTCFLGATGDACWHVMQITFITFFFGFSQCACPNNSLVLWIVCMSCHGSLLVPMMTLHISCSYVCPVDDLDYINDIPMHAVLTTTPSQWTSCLVLLSCYLCIPLELCYVQIVCCIISTNYKYLSAWCWIGPFYSAQE